jgi:signal peptidase
MANHASALEVSVTEPSVAETSSARSANATKTAPLLNRERPASRALKKKRRRVFQTALASLVVGVSMILLWPAQYGGISGLTVVNGHSMEPTYATNDVIVTVRTPVYGVGEIITYQIPEGQPGAGGRVIHRIVTATNVDGTQQFVTKGDNNSTVDPWTISSSDVLGRAIFQAPQMGNLVGTKVNPFLLGGVVASLFVMFAWRFTRGTQAKKPPANRKQ